MKNITLKNTNTDITIQKIDRQTWSALYDKYADDWEALIYVNDGIYDQKEISLGELFAALFMQFGESEGYDEYKCSFSYSFKVSLEKEGETNEFLLNIYDYKGGMPSYKFYGNEPKNEVLMQQDLKYIALELLEYLITTFRTEHADFNENFYRVNPAGLLIYGFENGQFFQHQQKPHKEYASALFQDKITQFEGRDKFISKMSR